MNFLVSPVDCISFVPQQTEKKVVEKLFLYVIWFVDLDVELAEADSVGVELASAEEMIEDSVL